MTAGGKLNASQFYITTGEDLDSLDEKYTIFGEVAEGMDVVDAINEAYCDEDGRPYQNIRCACWKRHLLGFHLYTHASVYTRCF